MPTISQRYLSYSHVPLKLIVPLEIQVFKLYYLYLKIKRMLYLASFSDARALQVEKHNQKEREGNKTLSRMIEERGKLGRRSVADLVLELVGRCSATAKMAAVLKSWVDKMHRRQSGNQCLPWSTLTTQFEFVSGLIVHVQMLPYKG